MVLLFVFFFFQKTLFDISCNRDNLNEMSKPGIPEKIGKIFQNLVHCAKC